MSSTAPAQRSKRKSKVLDRLKDQQSDGPPSESATESASSTLVDSASRVDPAKVNQRLFLSILYSEIDLATSATLLPSSQLLITVQGLIRIARTRVFFRTLTEKAQSSFGRRAGALKSENPFVQRTLSILRNDVRKIESLRASHLDEAVSRLGYPVLSCCLLSEAFRFALDLEDCDADETDLPWHEKLDELAKNVSSLELFAKTRGFNCRDRVTASDGHFQTFLQNIGIALANTVPKSLEAGSFGAKQIDMAEKHQINPQVLNPHLWVLPIDKNAAATRPIISYPNSARLKREFPANQDLEVLEDQHPEDIGDSLVLQTYKWPNMKQWPEDDPRYAGFEGDACEVCGHFRSLIPRTRKSPHIDARFRRCTCKLKDLNGFQPPLLELFDTGRMGTGVRALQNIGTGIILGDFVGEIYPAHKTRLQEPVSPRYGGDHGPMYRLELPIVKRHVLRKKRKVAETTDTTDEPAAKKMKTAKSKSKSSTSDAEEKQRTRVASLEPEEYNSYVTDAALKGNWTRYINHSCDPNTEFITVNIGMRTTPVIQSKRNIKFGEDITISYGDRFLKDRGIACRCGLDICLKWDKKDMGKEGTELLGDAVANGAGPDWVGGQTGGRKSKIMEAARAAKVLLEQVIEVTDKMVLKAATRKRDSVRKKRGYTPDEESEAEPTSSNRATSKIAPRQTVAKRVIKTGVSVSAAKSIAIAAAAASEAMAASQESTTLSRDEKQREAR